MKPGYYILDNSKPKQVDFSYQANMTFKSIDVGITFSNIKKLHIIVYQNTMVIKSKYAYYEFKIPSRFEITSIIKSLEDNKLEYFNNILSIPINNDKLCICLDYNIAYNFTDTETFTYTRLKEGGTLVYDLAIVCMEKYYTTNIAYVISNGSLYKAVRETESKHSICKLVHPLNNKNIGIKEFIEIELSGLDSTPNFGKIQHEVIDIDIKKRRIGHGTDISIPTESATAAS